MADRLCLQGVLYVLYNDIAWPLLPLELGFGSGQTCWRRLERGQQADVFDQLHRILLAELNAAGELDWSRACVDGSHIRAKKGGPDTGPSPVDRRKTGSKHHLICDGRGTPLKVITTAANVNDVTQTLALVDGIRPSQAAPADHAAAPMPSSATRATTPRPTTLVVVIAVLAAAVAGKLAGLDGASYSTALKQAAAAFAASVAATLADVCS